MTTLSTSFHKALLELKNKNAIFSNDLEAHQMDISSPTLEDSYTEITIMNSIIDNFPQLGAGLFDSKNLDPILKIVLEGLKELETEMEFSNNYLEDFPDNTDGINPDDSTEASLFSNSSFRDSDPLHGLAYRTIAEMIPTDISYDCECMTTFPSKDFALIAGLLSKAGFYFDSDLSTMPIPDIKGAEKVIKDYFSKTKTAARPTASISSSDGVKISSTASKLEFKYPPSPHYINGEPCYLDRSSENNTLVILDEEFKKISSSKSSGYVFNLKDQNHLSDILLPTSNNDVVFIQHWETPSLALNNTGIRVYLRENQTVSHTPISSNPGGMAAYSVKNETVKVVDVSSDGKYAITISDAGNIATYDLQHAINNENLKPIETIGLRTKAGVIKPLAVKINNDTNTISIITYQCALLTIPFNKDFKLDTKSKEHPIVNFFNNTGLKELKSEEKKRFTGLGFSKEDGTFIFQTDTHIIPISITGDKTTPLKKEFLSGRHVPTNEIKSISGNHTALIASEATRLDIYPTHNPQTAIISVNAAQYLIDSSQLENGSLVPLTSTGEVTQPKESTATKEIVSTSSYTKPSTANCREFIQELFENKHLDSTLNSKTGDWKRTSKSKNPKTGLIERIFEKKTGANLTIIETDEHLMHNAPLYVPEIKSKNKDLEI
jgi:hypothetical protein